MDSVGGSGLGVALFPGSIYKGGRGVGACSHGYGTIIIQLWKWEWQPSGIDHS